MENWPGYGSQVRKATSSRCAAGITQPFLPGHDSPLMNCQRVEIVVSTTGYVAFGLAVGSGKALKETSAFAQASA
jgi:hypothetical protein